MLTQYQTNERQLVRRVYRYGHFLAQFIDLLRLMVKFLQRLSLSISSLLICGSCLADLVPGAPLEGAWVTPDVPGQGFVLDVIESQDTVFMAWFTFPEASPGGSKTDELHRWYTLQGPLSGELTRLQVYQTSGGVFLGGTTPGTRSVGEAELRFFDCQSGELILNFDDETQNRQIALRRVARVDPLECRDLREPQAFPDRLDESQSVAFMDVNVLMMPSAEVLERQMVIVESGEIQYVGGVDLALLADEMEVFEARGHWLMPGMVDTHTHLAINVNELLGVGASASLTEESATNQLLLYLSQGVTTILNNGDFGEPVVGWGNELKSGQRHGPTLYAARYARGGPGTFDGGPQGQIVSDANQARDYTRDAFESGYSHMKIYNGTPREAVLAIFDEAHDLGMPVIGHFPLEMTLLEALSGMDMVAHTGTYLWQHFNNSTAASDAAIEDVVRLTRERGVRVTPTLGIEVLIEQIFCGHQPGIDAYWARPETVYMHPTTVSLNERSIAAGWRWDPPGCTHASYALVRNFIEKLTLALHSGGVPLLLGSDSPSVLGVPGFSARFEVQELVNSGISLSDALRIATWNGGQFLGNGLGDGTPFGAIRSGWKADLLLLEANPLASAANLAQIAGVMTRGKWYSRSWLDQELETIAESYR